jgi:hypothetical protein
MAKWTETNGLAWATILPIAYQFQSQ